MSRSEDYLDQLLKGVEPEDVKEETAGEKKLEENIFGDIFEELADGNEMQEESFTSDVLKMEDSDEVEDSDDIADFDEDDIFGEDFLDDDFLDDEFLKEFEMELEKLDTDSVETGSVEDDLSSFDDLDSILSGAKEQMEAVETIIEPQSTAEQEIVSESEEDESIEALLGLQDENTMDVETPAQEEPAVEPSVNEGGFDFSSLFAEDGGSGVNEGPQEDADVLKILEGLDGIDLELDDEDMGVSDGAGQDFSALEGFLAASAAEPTDENSAEKTDEFSLEENAEANGDTAKGKKKSKKDKKSGEKTGFLNKLGLILFGEDDEDEEESTGKKNVDLANITIGEASEDDLALFGEYSEKVPSAPSAEDLKKAKKAEKEKKKKEKKEAKEKAKKEKKEKPPKPKKEKKPKPPKEPDNTPPLPKKPVILIFLMVASFVALVVLGADLLGYSNQLTNAKNQYAKKNYSEAFAEISGIEIKEEDLALYEKYHVMAMVSVELEAYESLMSKNFYDMALDCLVRTIGRAEKYRADAEIYGCIQELNELELEAETILSETFGVSREEALEFYAYRDKKDYSIAIKNVIKGLGLE